ncbi:MAG: hypothetical protein A3K83_04670 [Omnitrophica WOR_2 bacterium RBG_13_44_8b]|nr:MAG: hypothetical protein A3K83_04670 [Omnitrophica WOR_2 bacterium RBG_13_44_8b]
MTDDIKSIEKEAHRLLEEKEYQKAAGLFYQVADTYIKGRQYQQAALCLAQAAGCWALKAGEKSFYNAAAMYEKAAKQAESARDFEYASLLHKHAAVCYERDLEYLGFSECFYRSKECYRTFLKKSLFHAHKSKSLTRPSQNPSLKDLTRKFISWCFLTFSWILWGYGERPQRTIIFGCLLILGFALLYTCGFVMTREAVVRPKLPEALYFSVVTFTTVGYGDIVPLGLNKAFAVLEAFGGVFITPVFITGLFRKYLRF